MLHTFGHSVAICCNMLDDVGSNLKTVKFFVQHFGCCTRLATCNLVPRARFSFGQHQVQGLWPLPIFMRSRSEGLFL